jgi:hypothetical protein
LTDELQDALVSNPLGNQSHQDVVVDPVKELLQVDVHDGGIRPSAISAQWSSKAKRS